MSQLQMHFFKQQRLRLTGSCTAGQAGGAAGDETADVGRAAQSTADVGAIRASNTRECFADCWVRYLYSVSTCLYDSQLNTSMLLLNLLVPTLQCYK